MDADFWEGEAVLVTGAGGFIASHLVEALVRLGARVRAFVRYNSRGEPGLLRFVPMEVLRQIEIIAGDLRDIQAVNKAMEAMDYVFHLGALVSIPYSYHHPLEVVETNIIGTMNLLLAARWVGVKRFVHTSSSEVYGTALYVPMDENHPLQGQSPYSASKIGADKLVESFYRAFDMSVVTLRPFNTYGPRQSARAVVSTIILQALTQEVIYLGNLDARRDLTYISDTVEGFLKVAQTSGIEGEAFNLGSGKDISIGELALEIISIIGKEIPIQVEPSRLRPQKSEVHRLLSDNRRARERLGWQPNVSLKRGLECTIAWVQEHLEFYQFNQYQL